MRVRVQGSSFLVFSVGLRERGRLLNSTEVLFGAVGAGRCGGTIRKTGGVAKEEKERWELRVRGKIRATERIQRLSGGVAEADPWGGNENNKEKKSQRYGKFMGLYLFSIKEFAKKSFSFSFGGEGAYRARVKLSKEPRSGRTVQ